MSWLECFVLLYARVSLSCSFSFLSGARTTHRSLLLIGSFFSFIYFVIQDIWRLYICLWLKIVLKFMNNVFLFGKSFQWIHEPLCYFMFRCEILISVSVILCIWFHLFLSYIYNLLFWTIPARQFLSFVEFEWYKIVGRYSWYQSFGLNHSLRNENSLEIE
jgi:hypothetical protein